MISNLRSHSQTKTSSLVRFSVWVCLLFVLALKNSNPLLAAKRNQAGSNRRSHHPLTVYVIRDAITLHEISILHYGSKRYARKIIQWNKLKNPNRLFLGQRLKLKKKPTLSATEGNQLLLKMWRKQLSVSESEETGATTQTEKKVTTYSEAKAILNQFRKDPEIVLESGQELFQKKEFAKALPLLRASRKKDPESTSAWLLEIRALIELKQEEAAQTLAKEFIQLKPQLSSLPIFRKLIAPQRVKP